MFLHGALLFNNNLKTYISIVVAAATILFTACVPNETDKIERAAKGYLDAVGNYRIDEAAPFATKQTCEKSLPWLNKMMERSDSTFIKANQPATIKIKETRMLSDTSARVYYHKSTPIKEDDDSVTVILENGQWLVDVKVTPLTFLDSVYQIKRTFVR